MPPKYLQMPRPNGCRSPGGVKFMEIPLWDYLLLIEPGSWSLTTSGHVSRGGNIGTSTQLIRLVMLLATATAVPGGLR